MKKVEASAKSKAIGVGRARATAPAVLHKTVLRGLAVSGVSRKCSGRSAEDACVEKKAVRRGKSRREGRSIAAVIKRMVEC